MSNPRRRVGLSAFSRNSIASAQYVSHGNTIRTAQNESLATQLSVFQQLLHQFSVQHGKEIRSNPTFRAEFARMCAAIGVDPLVSSSGQAAGAGGSSNGNGRSGGSSFWAQMLGGSVNDFYFELAVRLVEVCRETRSENGGLIAVTDVQQRVKKGRGVGGGLEVSEYARRDDVLRAVRSLEPLGPGISTLKLGSQHMIQSIPRELNPDQATVLEVTQILSYVTTSMLQDNLNWEEARAIAVLDDLVADSLLWLDTQAAETEYWSPAHMHDRGVYQV